jgi:hypothetical protein
MRIKDPEFEELRHALAHLHCALDAVVEELAAYDPQIVAFGTGVQGARRHLADCEAAIFDVEELTDGIAHTVPQEAEAQEEAEEDAEKEAEEEEPIAARYPGSA